MDINVAIEILSLIAQVYATILSIVSAVFIFAIEYHKSKEKGRERFEDITSGILRISEAYDSFARFFFINALEIAISLIAMWLIGVSTFQKEELAYVMIGLIVFAIVGFLGVYHFIIRLIQDVTREISL